MKFKSLVESESMECDAFCEWANLHPKIGKFLISIPNQALCYTNPGVRKKLSRQGVKKGIPDYFLAIPSCGYSGLFLEMKKIGGKLSPEQVEWRDKLNAIGYKSVVVYGAEEAIKAVNAYILHYPNCLKDENAY